VVAALWVVADVGVRFQYMFTDQIALVVSFFSVIVASLALGWNIYRDIILKPKVEVTFDAVTLYSKSWPHQPQYLNLKAINFGPGVVNVNNVRARNAPLWRRVLRKEVRNAIIFPDYTNQMSARLPAKIEVLLPYDKECFLNSKFTDVGFNDYYGRTHWAPRRQLKKVYAKWRKDFQNQT
jgi:hypothetical protein